MINQTNSHIDPPLVSCIIIFFNGEKYLAEAIDSILAQTYDHWELFLVNDGSTDHSGAIARQYVEKYPDKIFYLEHPQGENRGMSATRNLGVHHARGEYIAFLDADDVWLPAKLTEQVNILETLPEAGLVCGPTQYWYSWTGEPADQDKDTMREIGVPANTLYQPPHLLTLMLKNQANAPATCGVLIRRQVFQQVGYFVETFRGLFEDRAFFAKVYAEIPVYVMDHCGDRYRQHDDSCCFVAQKTGYQPFLPSEPHYTFLKWMREYLQEKGSLQNQEVLSSLKIGLWPYEEPWKYYIFVLKAKIQYRFGKILSWVTNK